MAFVWIEPLNVGSYVTKDFLTESQSNIDGIDNSLSCGADDTSVFETNDTTYDMTDDGTIYGTQYTSRNSGNDGSYDGTDNGSDWGYCPGVNGTYYTPVYETAP